MRPLHQISFVLEGFKLGSPGQQLLDRFLLGFPHQGSFHRFPNIKIAAHLQGADDGGFARRAKEHPLAAISTVKETLSNADAVILAGTNAVAAPRDELIAGCLHAMPAESRMFVYGPLGSTRAAALHHAQLADRGSIKLIAGTTLAHTPRLPDIDLAMGSRIREGLIVVPRSPQEAALTAAGGLFPIVERRAGGETGVVKIQFLAGDQVWLAGQDRLWSWPLLAAAISRSDSPLGDPVKDGRTQDIVGLRLLAGLVPEPRAWLLEHRDGFRSAILNLEGAVTDINFAIRARDGTIVSAQLYRPPPPQEHHYSALAAVLARYFTSGATPWGRNRDLWTATVVSEMRSERQDGTRSLPL